MVLALRLTGSIGMYSRTSWGGPVDPFILVKFLNDTAAQGDDPIASLVIFEWRDSEFIGIPDPDIQATVRLPLSHGPIRSATTTVITCSVLNC